MKRTTDVLPFGDYLRRLRRKAKQYRRSRSRLSAIREVLEYYEGVSVRDSFADETGRIWDCVEATPLMATFSAEAVEKIPVLPETETALPRHSREALPPVTPREATACPEGCVPLQRLTIRIAAANLLLTRRKQLALRLEARAGKEATFPRHHAVCYEHNGNRGAMAIVSVQQPLVRTPPQYFSLCQIWVSGGPQVIEVGWQVCPARSGHSRPVLFAYCTTDNYQTGYYDADPRVFVPNPSARVRLGQAFTAVSTPGAAVEVSLAFQLVGNRWHLYVNSELVGYYPTSVFRNGALAQGGGSVSTGGEVSSDGAWPAMGSGQLAEAGLGQAAHVRNVHLITPAGAARPLQLNPFADNPGYTLQAVQVDGWGSAFLYGGPGAR